MTLLPQEREQLVRLARSAVEAAVGAGPLPTVAEPEGVLVEVHGCFVTLTNHGHLRGCIGTFRPADPLAVTVAAMARAAARDDPRFFNQPITPDELPDLTVEVSVLSPLTPTDHPETLRVGVDGIYIVHGARSGCFLPEVATDMGWTAEEFLSQCCAGKAGLPPDAWRQGDTQVYLFTTEKFRD